MIIKRQVKQIKPSYNRLTEDHLRGHTKLSSKSCQAPSESWCSVRGEMAALLGSRTTSNRSNVQNKNTKKEEIKHSCIKHDK